MHGLIPALAIRKLAALTSEARATIGLSPLPFAAHFDVIAGTSTGAILAVGLAGRRANGEPLASPEALVRFFTCAAQTVFLGDRSGRTRGLFGPKYSRQRLARIFDDICGEARLSEAAAHLVIPAYAIDTRSTFLFRGGRTRGQTAREDFFLRDVLLATTAAPYLFPPARVGPIGSTRRHVLIDGGVFANNPALHGYFEAHRIFGRDRDIFVLSLGTGTDAAPIRYHEAQFWGLWSWLSPRRRLPLLQLCMHGQADDADHHLARLVPDPARYIRLNPPATGVFPAFDDASPKAIARLERVAQEFIASEENRLRLVAEAIVRR